MQIEFHRLFRRKYKRVPPKIRSRFNERLFIFKENIFYPQLNNHFLTGNKEGQWSINVTGDWRAIYVFRNENTAVFIDIDKHNNFYK